jgi:hypothetical protein
MPGPRKCPRKPGAREIDFCRYKQKPKPTTSSLKLPLQDATHYSLAREAASDGGQAALCDQEATEGAKDSMHYSLAREAASDGGQAEQCDQEATEGAKDSMHYSLAREAASDGGQAALCDQQATEGAKLTRLQATLLAHVRSCITVLHANVHAGL